jgi:hypothetical protein
VTDSPSGTTQPRPHHTATAWRGPALVMLIVGYGANQFVPLLAVYRRTLALSDAQATAIFGVYALGLIPGLLLAGPAGDRYGRRPLMIGFAVLSLLATAVLITGRWGTPGLYAGRLLTGVVSGGAFAVGTAWVKELSGAAPPGAGARRAALALTAGFAVGPLVAGLLAQWAPEPQLLPYLLHLLLAAAALALLLRTPETVPARPAGRQVARPGLVRSARSRRFTRVLVPLGPWVFGSVTLVFTTLPAHATGPVRGLTVAFPGALAALALGAGIAVQPLGRRLQDASVARGTADAAATGLALVTGGCLAAAAATAHPGVAAATGSALLLGAGYGLCILAGLREVEHLAPAGELGSLVAIFYSLAYAGLLIPYLLALAAPHLGYPTTLLLAALAATLTLLLVAAQDRRHPTPTED